MILIILGVLALVFMSFQLLVYKSTKNTLKYNYKVEKKYKNIETRIYDEAMFAKIELTKSEYKTMSSKGFRVLADYIFGNNEKNAQISMTSPVVMEMNKNYTMEFMMPNDFDKNSLPLPNNKKIEIYTKPSWRSASITFGGFANDKVIEEKIAELTKELELQNIKHRSNFKFLGYNPPYQLIDRKNEIVVEIQ